MAQIVKTATQRNRILQHFASGAPLTPADARRLFGCDRLAARVKELRDQGWQIIDGRKTLKVRHSVYRMRTIGNQGLLLPVEKRGRPE